MERPPSTHCEAIGACVVIPVFNHARTVGEVVRGARAHAHTVLVCDDGSTDGSGGEAHAAGAELLTHPANRGKGAALRTLLEEAGRRGFAYAICLDADGQHFPRDIPRLVEAVRDRPGAIVVGARDLAAAGAPPSSQFGRKFSNFWVWFEGGQKVDDSQSGFRAYPLPETLALMGRRTRYDFEVEVLLRASWSGLLLRSTKIDVRYGPDRVTHFRAFRDNARISILNLLTILRMLLPLPLAPLLHYRARRPGLSLDAIRRWFWLGGPGPLWRVVAAALALLGPWGVVAAAATGAGAFAALVALWALGAVARLGQSPTVTVLAGAFVVGLTEVLLRKKVTAHAGQPAARLWDGKHRAGVWGHAFFYLMVKEVGLWAAYAVLYFVTAWFVAFEPAGRRASMQFLDRAIGQKTGLAALARTYRHMLEFARTILDRVVLGVEGPGSFTLAQEEGLERILSASASKSGSVLLTGHLGSWELAAGLIGDRLVAPFDIVAFDGEDAAVREAIERSSEKFKPNVLKVGKGDLAALDILRALREGHMIALQGDRSVDGRTAVVDFLGHPAEFPVGAFVIAALAGAPLIATFGMQVGPFAYEFVAFEPERYTFDRSKSRDEQLQQWVQGYVRKLEGLVRKYPFQWFNFYDFWAKPVERAAAPPAAAPPQPVQRSPVPSGVEGPR